MDIMLAGVITGFFMFHCYLLSGAYTTIEFCEKLRTKDTNKKHKTKNGKEIHASELYKESPYDRGLCLNICHLLGALFLLLLVFVWFLFGFCLVFVWFLFCDDVDVFEWCCL